MSHFISEYWNSHAHLWNNDLVVRFPPEPNGFLHLGHIKALLINADLARDHGGTFLLRMDDTNPRAEKIEFEHAIVKDVEWLDLGIPFTLVHASDHFDLLRDLAFSMIDHGLAYVDETPRETMALMRGDFHHPGTPSADRDMEPSIHRARFEAMCTGAYAEGEAVLRCKLDLAHPNMIMRDPVIWRILNDKHPRLPHWTAFPTYDFAHPFCDLRDRIALSLCSLEFEDHKPFYNHVVETAIALGFGWDGRKGPVELEFARLEPSVGATSKRTLKEWVESGAVTGWDDPRLLTVGGLRARGYTAAHIKSFVRRLGVGRSLSVAPMEWMDEAVREHGSHATNMIVEDPVSLHLEGDLPDHMMDANKLPVAMSGRDFWVSALDVRAVADRDFYRLAPGHTVRVMGLGGFVVVDRVECEEERPVRVVGRFVSTGQSKATVHAIPASLARACSVERVSTWDGLEDSGMSWTRRRAMVLGDERKEEIVHAVRMGWGRWIDEGRFRLVAGMRGNA